MTLHLSLYVAGGAADPHPREGHTMAGPGRRHASIGSLYSRLHPDGILWVLNKRVDIL